MIDSFLKRLSPKFVRNFNLYKTDGSRRALILFKTDWVGPFGLLKHRSPRAGSTSFQSYACAKILNQLGYQVSIVDRSAKLNLTETYDVFLGLVVGGSGRYFMHYVNQLPKSTKKIGLSTGANPKLAKRNYEARLAYFRERNGFEISTISRVSNYEIDPVLNSLDHLIYHGNDFVRRSYANMSCCTTKVPSPLNESLIGNIRKDSDFYDTKFIFYAGSGLIHKGLDLVLEAFMQRPEYELSVCVMQQEPDFFNFYEPLPKNVKLIETTKMASTDFRKLALSCHFVISASCSEGDPLSVLECMRLGLIPITTSSTDINHRGIHIHGSTVDKVVESIDAAKSLSREQLAKLSLQAILCTLFNTPSHYEANLYSGLAIAIFDNKI